MSGSVWEEGYVGIVNEVIYAHGNGLKYIYLNTLECMQSAMGRNQVLASGEQIQFWGHMLGDLITGIRIWVPCTTCLIIMHCYKAYVTTSMPELLQSHWLIRNRYTVLISLIMRSVSSFDVILIISYYLLVHAYARGIYI